MRHLFFGIRKLAVPLLVLAGLSCCPQAMALEGRLDVLAGAYDGTFESVDVVNYVTGAQIFYDAGYFGQNTIIANVEAGHVWSGHEVFDRSGLGMANAPSVFVNAARDPETAPDLGDFDYHATAVGHVLAGTGDDGSGNLTLLGAGMAPLATLWSGAIATQFDRSEGNIGSFSISTESFLTPYLAFFQGTSGTKADVINSSWGFTDPAGNAPETRILDALSAKNPTVTFVKSAGNGGPTAAPGGPGSGFNGITVGSLGGANDATLFNRPSDFTSSKAGDFYNPQTDTTISGVRATVSIAAPGEEFALAAYLGKSGSLADLVGDGDLSTDKYFTFNQSGTSFASPVVAGGVALLKDVSLGGVYLVGNDAARDTRVIKSVIQAGAKRTSGWDNGQHLEDGILVTTQALDYAVGAGGLDLERSAGIYVGGTADVAGDGGGFIESQGWDIGVVNLGSANDYFFDLTFDGPVELTVSLNWFVNEAYDAEAQSADFLSFANLNLEVWTVSGGSFLAEIAESSTLYNNSEFLRFTLGSGVYGLRVTFDDVIYDLTGSLTSETYGLAWNVAAVPESRDWGIAMCVLLGVVAFRRRARA